MSHPAQDADNVAFGQCLIQRNPGRNACRGLTGCGDLRNGAGVRIRLDVLPFGNCRTGLDGNNTQYVDRRYITGSGIHLCHAERDGSGLTGALSAPTKRCCVSAALAVTVVVRMTC
jgi:hypothetical protein